MAPAGSSRAAAPLPPPLLPLALLALLAPLLPCALLPGRPGPARAVAAEATAAEAAAADVATRAAKATAGKGAAARDPVRAAPEVFVSLLGRNQRRAGAPCVTRDGRAGVCRPAWGCPAAAPAQRPCGRAAPLCCPAPGAQRPAKAERMCNRYIQIAQNISFSYRTKRVAVGKVVQSCEFPHMVAVGTKGIAEGVQWVCAGTLISEQYVLTAGHCVNGSSGPASVVRLGALNSLNDSDANDFAVEKSIPHPSYRPDSHEHDLALLRLRGTVNFTRAVRPACLQAARQLPRGRAVAAGWGDTSPRHGTGSNHLMKVELDVQNKETCEKAYSPEKRSSKLRHGFKDDIMICTGNKEGVQNTCKGDSGGPLKTRLDGVSPCTFRVMGVTSFGQGLCGFPNSYSVFTRVSSYISWIESIVWPNEV